jgi:hypothetical protein
MTYEEAMNRLALLQVAAWHQEQADELVDDEMQQEIRDFHLGAALMIQEFVK